MSGEATFGIKIEGQARGLSAFDEAIRKDEELIRSIERLIAVSERTAQSTQFVTDTLKFAAEETARLAEEQKRLAEETEKAEQASRKAAEAAAAEAASRKRQREEIFEWTFAIAAVGSAMVAASDRAGDFQEKTDLVRETTGLAAREQAALALGLSNIGRSYDQASPSIDMFVRKLGQAREELRLGKPGPAVAAFDATGIVGGLDRSNGAVLQEIGEKLAAIEDPAERSRLAFELFGRSFQTILPVIMKDLSALADEAERSGRVFSDAMEKTATEADIQGDRIKSALGGVTNQLSVGLAGQGGNAIKSFIADAAEGFAEFLTWINKSDDELGHFRINLTNTKFPKGISFQGGESWRDTPGKELFYGDAYGAQPGPMLGPPSPTDEQWLASQKATRDAVAAEIAAGEAAKELAEAKRAWIEAAKLEGGLDEPFGVDNRIRAITIGRDALKQVSAGGAVGERASGGSLTVDEEIFTAFDKFMAQFKEAVPILYATADAEGRVNERAAAFTATLMEQEPAWRKGQRQAEDFERRIDALGDTLKGGVSDAISDLILHTGSLEDALDKLLDSMVRQMVDMGVNALFSLQQGGTFLQGGGMFTAQDPFHAQSGVVVSGVRGADTHLGRFGRGEAVLDHGLTDDLKAFVRDSRNGSVGGQPIQQTTNVIAEGAIQYHGVFANVSELEQASRDYIFPMLIDYIRRGAGS